MSPSPALSIMKTNWILNNRSDCLTHSIYRKKSRTCLVLEFLCCDYLGVAEWAQINEWLKVCWTCWEWNEPTTLKWMVSWSSVQQLKVKSIELQLDFIIIQIIFVFLSSVSAFLIFSLWILKWIGTWKMVVKSSQIHGFQVWCLFWLL